MNMKVFMLCAFYGFSFQHFMKACESKESSLIVLGYQAMPDYEDLDLTSLSLTTPKGFDLKRAIGTPVVKIASIKILQEYGLQEKESFVFLEKFIFENGHIRYVGVLPEKATVYTLPSSLGDTFSYKCFNGNIITIPLSKIPTSFVHPKN